MTPFCQSRPLAAELPLLKLQPHTIRHRQFQAGKSPRPESVSIGAFPAARLAASGAVQSSLPDVSCSASHVRDAIRAVEKIKGSDAAAEELIRLQLGNCLTETSLDPDWDSHRKVGKVRDTYRVGNKVVIVTTDRLSAFDRHLASIPFKGQVLNQTSAWWMRKCEDIVPHALLTVPHPNVTIMRACDVFPVEFVVRGFLTGSTDTSLWTHYERGERTYCGHSLPDNMRKNQRLQHNILTPTTKAEDHDVPISAQGIVQQGIMTDHDWQMASAMAMALFEEGQRIASEHGLILVDTKYEFGKTPEGEIVVVDEVHTPDSSRFWLADSYEDRHAAGQEPDSIDKEFIRLWFRQHCDPYNDEVLPKAPEELRVELSRRYMRLYEMITDEIFSPSAIEKGNMVGETRYAMHQLVMEKQREKMGVPSQKEQSRVWLPERGFIKSL